MAKAENAKVTAKAEAADKKREKPQKVVRIAYPGIKVGPDGKGTVKLKEWPSDFDPKQHVPLLRTDFENEAPWLIARAERFERAAKRMREEAELAVKFGNKEIRAQARKFKRVSEQMNKIAADLAAQGIDPTAFMKQLEESLAATKSA